MFFAKIVQTSGMTKEKTKFFFFIPECSLYYSKIVQMSGMAKEKTKFFFFFLECSLSSRDSANEWNGKTLENLLFLRDL